MNEISGDVNTDSAAPVQTREVMINGEAWIVRLAGTSAAGSGALGLGMLEGVDFALASKPDTAVREILIQRGRFDMLYDQEIIEMFSRAHPVTTRIMTRKSLEDPH